MTTLLLRTRPRYAFGHSIASRNFGRNAMVNICQNASMVDVASPHPTPTASDAHHAKEKEKNGAERTTSYFSASFLLITHLSFHVGPNAAGCCVAICIVVAETLPYWREKHQKAGVRQRRLCWRRMAITCSSCFPVEIVFSLPLRPAGYCSRRFYPLPPVMAQTKFLIFNHVREIDSRARP